MQKKRRKWYEVVADWTGYKRQIDQAHDRAMEQHGYERGWKARSDALEEEWPSVFGAHPVYIPVASVQFLDDRAVNLAGYEPPERQTGPQLLPPNSLKKMIGTAHLPTVTGKAGKLLQKYNELQRKAGGE